MNEPLGDEQVAGIHSPVQEIRDRDQDQSAAASEVSLARELAMALDGCNRLRAETERLLVESERLVRESAAVRAGSKRFRDDSERLNEEYEWIREWVTAVRSKMGAGTRPGIRR
jgi:hypothetical protein